LLEQLFGFVGSASSGARQFAYRAVALQADELSDSDVAEL